MGTSDSIFCVTKVVAVLTGVVDLDYSSGNGYGNGNSVYGYDSNGYGYGGNGYGYGANGYAYASNGYGYGGNSNGYNMGGYYPQPYGGYPPSYGNKIGPKKAFINGNVTFELNRETNIVKVQVDLGLTSDGYKIFENKEIVRSIRINQFGVFKPFIPIISENCGMTGGYGVDAGKSYSSYRYGSSIQDVCNPTGDPISGLEDFDDIIQSYGRISANFRLNPVNNPILLSGLLELVGKSVVLFEKNEAGGLRIACGTIGIAEYKQIPQATGYSIVAKSDDGSTIRTMNSS